MVRTVPLEDLIEMLNPRDPSMCPNKGCKGAVLLRRFGRHECPNCGFTNSVMDQAIERYYAKLEYIPLVQELISARQAILNQESVISELQTRITELQAKQI